jgi:hypothetical protein
MAMSAAGQWLQQALLDLCSDAQSGVQLEQEVVSSLVSYCEIASPSDAEQYLLVSLFIIAPIIISPSMQQMENLRLK